MKNITGLKLPDWPIITRWGTWLTCANYLSLNKSKVFKFIESVQIRYITEVTKIQNSTKLDNELRKELSYKNISKKITFRKKQFFNH